MKKWLLVFALIVIVLLWQSVAFYQRTITPITNAEAKAVSAVKDAFDLKQIEDVSYFNAEEAYQVIRAVNHEGDRIILWVPESDELEIVSKKAEDGWEKDQVESFVKAELDVKKLKDVRLGLKNNIPVWEITFIDSDDRYNFYYLTFNGDTWLEHYRLKST